MIDTILILLAAHLLADFVLQSNWMIEHKRKPLVFGLHIAIVTGSAALLAGNLAFAPLLLLALTHAGLDAWKQYFSKKGGAAFAIDQAGHLISILVISYCFPDFARSGYWLSPHPVDHAFLTLANQALYLKALVLTCGYVATVPVGGIVMRLVFTGILPEGAIGAEESGLPAGGHYIGLLERNLIFFLVLTNNIEAVGFLIAAKSVLRFTVASDRLASEYVIIGTLFSFSWALIAAWLTRAALAGFPG